MFRNYVRIRLELTRYSGGVLKYLSATRSSNQPIMRTRSGSGDHMHKRGHASDGHSIRKSNSDSNLFKKNRSHHAKEHGAMYTSEHKQFFVTGASPSVDDEFSKALPPFEEYKDQARKIYHKHRSKSLDFLSHRAESPCFSESSECRSRSPSPTPSSGLENTSIKDSPMQIDAVVSSTDNSCNNSESLSSFESDEDFVHSISSSEDDTSDEENFSSV
ncbi:ral GTPase-activating protein subunit alpha-1 [Trichonephila clavipes]|uniref:Ral GTPase-activating protein subunit alpha-1 n=1 Tax=Trichonephila clavipes TaxID=2585209 RepID=A0A8X6V3R6_TRICX|nr:ral GTPase-activating protein subunit alpha-1 [Trichonephila clavipes]